MSRSLNKRLARFGRMTTTGSVTGWLRQLRGSTDSEAAQQLWKRFAPRLQRLTQKRVRALNQSLSYDEEDVSLSAYRTLVEAMRENRFPDVDDRESLWALLATIALRKANDYAKVERAERRYPGEPLVDASHMANVVASAPPPDLAATMLEDCRELLEALPDGDLQRTVLLKLDGYNNDEIATILGFSRRTIQRMLRLIRELWRERASR